MKTIDPGHYYFLDEYSGSSSEETLSSEQSIHFMHRIGNRYPNNQGSPYDGTNCQEAIRALIDRCHYLNNQIYCDETNSIIYHLREALYMFEYRAAKIHNMKQEFLILIQKSLVPIEELPTCRTCGHIVCRHTERK